MPLPYDYSHKNIAQALSPGVLRTYGAVVHGTDRAGFTDIAFPSMHLAGCWANIWGLEGITRLRQDDRPWFSETVVVQIHTQGSGGQLDPNGVYSPVSPSGTYVICRDNDPEGEYHSVDEEYWQASQDSNSPAQPASDR